MKVPQIWLAVLRIVVGAGFLKTVWTKLAVEFVWGVVPYLAVSPRFLGFQPKRVAEFANGNPVDWYKQFLEGTVLPHVLLITSMIIFLGARAGRVWGLDGLILREVSPSSRRWLSIIMVLTVFLLLPLSAATASAAYPGHFSHQSLNPR